jgi:hypothetical protein
MKEKQFKKEFKGIKMWKYVPLLIKQCKEYKDSRDDWMESALDLEGRKRPIIINPTIKIMSMPEVLIIILCILLLGFNYFVLKLLIGL